MSGSTSPQPGATYTGQVHPTGMTVLYDPSCPIVDICFVHGFTGHPERTWQSKKRAMNSEPSFQKLSKRAKLGQFTISTSDRGGSAHAEPQSAVFWPRDLLPGVIPHSRVLTFGYDTNIRHSFNGPISQNRLSDHAKDFLAALQDCRRHHSRRPLIFVAHSLGGLLVKDTLRLSKSFDPIQPDAYDIYMSTSSLFFFGTPHAGADPRNTLHKIICNLTRILCFRVNEEIVQALMPGAERSKLLAEDFPKWTFDRDWNIFSFQEEFAHSALGVKIVEDDSSCVNDPRHERTVHIKADHVDMCRFTSCDDPEFNKVCAALRQALEKLPSGQRDCQLGATECHRHASPEASSSMLSSKQVDTILERLTFDGIDARYWTLRSPQRKTCQWLLNHPSYKSWVDSSKTRDHHGFFWIKGKPGTGKSISMKYLDLKARRSMKNRIVLRFFFNARGAELEHSTEGMYRSLLWQLLKALPSNSLDSYPLTQLYSLDGAASLPVETLKEAFSSVLANVPSHEIYCFVDALDECAEEEIRQMIGFFEEIGESTALGELNTRVCFSSRHYPYITIRRSLQLILEDENDHSKDIQEYIESQLKIDNNDRDSIKDEIFDLSSKIFLWVALVVDILNKENDRGGDVSVRGRLDQIPRGLHELFQDILTRDNESIEEMILCIQWILFAKRPLQPMELYFAIRIGSHPNSDTSLNCDMHIDHINRFNLNASKGLAEVTKKGATIQFIHESVRDYLLRDGGLDTLLRSQIPRMNWSEGSSHNTLRDICLKQIHAGNTARESADKESSGSDMPFLQYAVSYILAHANSAQFLGLDQVNFLTNFPTDVWVILDNKLLKQNSRHHSNQVDILYLLAEQNLASLIHVHPQRHRSFLVPDGKERFPNPLVTAMAFGNNEAVFALALEFTRERFAANRPQDFKQVEQELRTMPQFKQSLSKVNWKKMNILTTVCSLGSVTLLDILWEDILGTGVRPEESLACLEYEASLDIYMYLIQKGAEIDSQIFSLDDAGRVRYWGNTVLLHAVKAGAVATVEILLSKGAKRINFGGCSYKLWSTMPDAIILLLIQYGHDVEHATIGPQLPTRFWDMILDLSQLSRDDLRSFMASMKPNGLRSLLLALSRSDDLKALSLLRSILEIDNTIISAVERRCNSVGGPIRLAFRKNNLEGLKILFEVGQMDINAHDFSGETILHLAITYTKHGMIKFLLDIGARTDIPNSLGYTPLFSAISQRDLESSQLLLSSPTINVNTQSSAGSTPLHLAASSRYLEIVELLLSFPKIDVDVQDSIGCTPLHLAASEGRLEIVKLLLSYPATSVNIQTARGFTPLHLAADRRHCQIVHLLLSFPAIDRNLLNSYGKTPFMCAVALGDPFILRLFLMDSRFDRTVTCDGEPVLKYAQRKLKSDTWNLIQDAIR